MIQQIIDNFTQFLLIMNITQEQAGEELGCSQEHLSRVLRGQRTPSIKLLMKMEEMMKNYGFGGYNGR